MVGTIRCKSCGKSRNEYLCSCGANKCYVDVYWKGKHYPYRRDEHGVDMGYYEAERFLTVLRSKIDRDRRGVEKFDPLDFLTAKINELRLGVVADKWLDDKLSEVSRNELSKGTYDTYLSHRRTWFSRIQEKDIREIDGLFLKAFKDTLTGKLKTRRNVLRSLQTMFKWAWRENIIKSVPPFPIIKGEDASPRKAITIESQEAYLSKIPDRHRDLFSFAFETGLREGELAALKVMDLDGPSVMIQRTYTSGNELRETTKGKRKEEIPLSSEAARIASKHASGKLPGAFIFINPDTARGYMPNMIYKLWKATGCPVTFHEACRHSFCTQIARTGAHLEQQRRLMRHSDIRTTMKYTHLDLTDLREIVDRRKVARFGTVRNVKKA